MPVMRCQINGKKGWKYGASGKCYTGPDSKSKAAAQGRAIKASQSRGDAASPDAVMQIEMRRQQMAGRKPRKFVVQKRLPKWLFPMPMEMEYEAKLVKYVEAIEGKIEKILIPHIPSLIEQRNAFVPESSEGKTDTRSDDWADDGERLMESVVLSLEDIPFSKPALAADIANKTNAWNDKEWKKILNAAFGVDVYQREPWLNQELNSFSKENVTLITKMEQDLLDDVSSTLQRSIKQGNSASTVAEEIRQRTNVSKSRDRLIARDQVGKLNGQLTELRQTNIGVTHYLWRDSDDKRVRPTHQKNDGKRFSWEKPPAGTGHPGQDIQCRCWAEPDFTPVYREIQPEPVAPLIEEGKLNDAQKELLKQYDSVQATDNFVIAMSMFAQRFGTTSMLRNSRIMSVFNVSKLKKYISLRNLVNLSKFTGSNSLVIENLLNTALQSQTGLRIPKGMVPAATKILKGVKVSKTASAYIVGADEVVDALGKVRRFIKTNKVSKKGVTFNQIKKGKFAKPLPPSKTGTIISKEKLTKEKRSKILDEIGQIYSDKLDTDRLIFMRDAIAEPHTSAVYIARDVNTGMIKGAMSIVDEKDALYISNLGSMFEKEAIGTQLIQEVLLLAKKRNIPVWLNSTPNSASFYEWLGFKQPKKNYFVARVNELDKILGIVDLRIGQAILPKFPPTVTKPPKPTAVKKRKPKAPVKPKKKIADVPETPKPFKPVEFEPYLPEKNIHFDTEVDIVQHQNLAKNRQVISESLKETYTLERRKRLSKRGQQGLMAIEDAADSKLSSDIFVARDANSGDIIGALAVDFGKTEGIQIHSLGTIYPDEAIGTELMERVFWHAKNSNRSILVSATKDSVPFYQRYGFNVGKVVKDTDIRMRLFPEALPSAYARVATDMMNAHGTIGVFPAGNRPQILKKGAGNRATKVASLGNEIRYVSRQELGIFIDARTGTTISRFRGGDSEISIDDLDLARFEDNIFIHNHSNNTSFSPPDLINAFATNLSKSIAVSPKYTYTISRKSGKKEWVPEMNQAEVESFKKEWQDSFLTEYRKLNNKLLSKQTFLDQADSDIMMAEATHTVNKKFASKYGFNYVRHPHIEVKDIPKTSTIPKGTSDITKLRSEAKKFKDTIKSQRYWTTRQGIDDYVQDAGESVNNYLLNPDEIRRKASDKYIDELETIIDGLDFMFDSLPYPRYAGESFRGMNFSPTQFDDFLDILDDAGRDGTISFPTFVSSTRQSSKAVHFMNRTSGYNVYMTIKGKNGFFIDDIFSTFDEKEILFRRDTKWKILSMEEQDVYGRPGLVLELEEL